MSIILVISLVVIACILSSKSEVDDSQAADNLNDYFSFYERPDGYSLSLKKHYEGELIIPEYYKNQPITATSDCGNPFGDDITCVYGSKNLIYIGAWSFSGQGGTPLKLKEIIFPVDGDLISIGAMAFLDAEV